MGSLRVVVIALALGAALTPPPVAQHFSDWAEPVNLGPEVNSASDDQSPAVSKDGLSLYFASIRPGGFGLPGTPGASDIWVSQRSSEDDPWGTPVNLGPAVNSSRIESRPELSRDGHWLFFASNRVGGVLPGLDLWASYREHVHDDFDWEPPIHLGLGVNGAATDFSPSYFENDDAGAPQLFFSSSRPGGPGAFDIYVSQQLSDGTWGDAQLVSDLSHSQNDLKAAIRFDGREAIIARGDPPNLFDFWVSTRDSVSDPWSPAILLDTISSATSDEAPTLSGDGKTLYFESTRPGGVGGRDLWMTTRTRARPH
jgi:WD40-like Beta Propeller Repeat